MNSFTFKACQFFSLLLAVMAFIFLPIILVCFPFVKQEHIRYHKNSEHWFRTYFLAVYDEINIRKKINKWFPLLNFARKIVMVYIAMLSSFAVGMQVIVLFYLNLYALIFIGNNRPYSSSFKNNLMIFNEACVCMMSFSMVMETDFCYNLEFRYTAGYLFVVFMLFNVGVNMVMMFSNPLRKL